MNNSQYRREMGSKLSSQILLTLSWIGSSVISLAITPILSYTFLNHNYSSPEYSNIAEIIKELFLIIIMNSMAGWIVGYSLEKISLSYLQNFNLPIRKWWILAFVLQGVVNLSFGRIMNWLLIHRKILLFPNLVNLSSYIEFFLAFSLCCIVGFIFTIKALNTQKMICLIWFGPLSCLVGMIVSTLTSPLLNLFFSMGFQFYDQFHQLLWAILFGATVGYLVNRKYMKILTSIETSPA
jgi:hypothetical protein